MNPNRKAFLDMIAWSELGPKLLAESDNGYNVVVGGKLFTSYTDHPRIKVYIPRYELYSTAAGRYQILQRTFDSYKTLLRLDDFSPASQDAIALRLIQEDGALSHIDAGDLDKAVAMVARTWASLPAAGYKQHENSIEKLRQAYADAGGVLSNSSTASA